MKGRISFPKGVVVVLLLVFGLIGTVGIVKKALHSSNKELVSNEKAQPKAVAKNSKAVQKMATQDPAFQNSVLFVNDLEEGVEFPQANKINRLFTTGSSKLPFVETIHYKGKEEWLEGKQPWVADYASHFGTSRHFIARSLNGKPDYVNQQVARGAKFNVFKKDKNINFYILVDLSRRKAAFYCYDLDTNQRMLLKSYPVSLGSLDKNSPSGCLTPVGKFLLGSKVAIYKPGSMGHFKNEKIEMMRVFGTRWIPFQEELDGTLESARGVGLHGAPWIEDEATGALVEDRECVNRYESLGCIRFLQEDIEEIFSIVITKPTIVEIVKDFRQANLPGVEVEEFSQNIEDSSNFSEAS